MTTSFFVSNTNTKTDKKSRIRMRLRDGRDLNLFGVTQEYIFPKYWDNKNHRLKSGVEFDGIEAFSTSLGRLRTFIEEAFYRNRKSGKIDKSWLKSAIELHYYPERGKPEEPTTLFEFIQDFIDKAPMRKNPQTSQAVCYKQTREYNRTFHYLKEFSKKQGREYDFSDINLDFYNNWVDYMEGEKLALNTIGKKIQTLKIFLNHAALNPRYKVNPEYKSPYFKNLTEESESIYLSGEELDQMYKLDLVKQPGMERVRDVFLIGAWTGCRFSDLPQVTRRSIKDGMIFITQGKTGNKVWIPMHPVVEAILDKYDFEIPHIITNQKFNKYLKDIAKEAKINSSFHKQITKGGVAISKEYKKWQLVVSHTARRSFATNLYKSGFPSISIMQITGHKTETAFLKYIKVTPEEHAKLLQMHWQKSAEHLKVV